MVVAVYVGILSNLPCPSTDAIDGRVVVFDRLLLTKGDMRTMLASRSIVLLLPTAIPEGNQPRFFHNCLELMLWSVTLSGKAYRLGQFPSTKIERVKLT